MSMLARDAVQAARHEIAGRRVWARGGRAYIEARGVHHMDAPAAYVNALEREVATLEGVNWAVVNGVLGDVIVDFDPLRVKVDDLQRVIGRVERDHGMAGRHRDRLMHPSGFEPIFDELVELGGDLLGATIGLAGRTLPGLSVPPEAQALVSGLELVPQLRQKLEAQFGTARVELAVSLAGSVLGAAAHTPLSSLADAALRAVELPAALSRRQVWEHRAEELAADRHLAKADAQPSPGERPAPLPDGPVERYAGKARLATGLAAAALLPISGVRKAARAVAVGAPKAVRMGVDAYAAEMGRILSLRGVVIRDPAPLRILDRIDTVIIDADVLNGNQGARLDPLTDALVAAAHQVGRVVITPISSGLTEQVGADGSVAGGSRLAASVRALQADGHAVALVATRNDPGLAAADCGIGVVRPGHRPPWAASLLCGPGLADPWLILQACAVARSSSDRSVQLAILGSICGALLGLIGPEQGAGRRGMLPISAAALASIAAAVWTANRLARRTVPPAADTTPWHAMSLDQTLHALGTDPTGLSTEQAAQRRDGQAGGGEASENLVTAAISELNTPLTAPLAAGAGVSAASGSPVDAGLVAAVMVGNAILGAVQRLAANRAVRTLADVGALRARLRRQDRDQITDASELVPGDIIALQAGDSVPADCRLIEADHLEVDESSLTGESMPVAKDPAPTRAAAVADRSSMLYEGTSVAAGRGVAVVVAVGRSTEAGRIAAATDTTTAPIGVEVRLRQMTAASIPVAVGAAAAVLGAGLLRGRLAESVSSAVALAVAAVPEGLPFTATVAQLAAARRLSRRKVLVRTPRTLEALGRVNTVCFDKTGTLTEGRIEVRRVFDGPTDEPIDALTGHRRAILAAALRASPTDDGQPLPHPTDQAVVTGGRAAGVARDDGEPGWHMVRELPFEPGRGYHAVLGQTDGRRVISVKGAPEIVLPRCVARRDGDGARALTDTDRVSLMQHIAQLAHRGYRVLAVAERSASRRRELDARRVERLEFLGLLCLADPVRATAAAAVHNLRRAGVEVVMLTGDHPSTAEAIATELGLRTTGRVITGPEVEALSEAELAELGADSAVFARVSPAHKVAIVRALQRAGQVVAVTGDGANDAPAIRLADVGIALGPQSTPAAKHAADIVITDERIETVVDAVIESRAMWRSVRDSVALLLGGNLGEIAFTLGSTLISARPPLNARQLLAVNLLTDLLPALAVAVRPPRNISPEALLSEGPDAAVSGALTRDIIARAIATTLATTGGWLTARAVTTPGGASTVALASLVGGQLAQTAASAHGDPVVLAAAVGSAAALIALVQFPPTSVFFGCRPLWPLEWAIAGAASVSAVVASSVAAKQLQSRSATATALPA